MTTCAVCLHQPSRSSLSINTTTIIAVITAMTFSAYGEPRLIARHGFGWRPFTPPYLKGGL
jgi:hypothetical protein